MKMKRLMVLVFLVTVLVPFHRAHSERALSYDDFVGLYKPSGDATASWIKIVKAQDGLNLDFYLVTPDMKSQTKIFTSEAGRFQDAPVWMSPQNLFSMSKEGVEFPLGNVSTQVAPTPAGFVVVQSQANKMFLGSDFIQVAQFDRPAGPVLKLQWRTVRFSKESLAAGQALVSLETLLYQKQTAI